MGQTPILLSKDLIDQMISSINDKNNDEIVKCLESLKVDYNKETVLELCTEPVPYVSVVKMLICIGKALWYEFCDIDKTACFNIVFCNWLSLIDGDLSENDDLENEWETFLETIKKQNPTMHEFLLNIKSLANKCKSSDSDELEQAVENEVRVILDSLKKHHEYVEFISEDTIINFSTLWLKAGKSTNINSYFNDLRLIIEECYKENKNRHLYMLLCIVYTRFLFGCFGLIVDLDAYKTIKTEPLYSIKDALNFCDDASLFGYDTYHDKIQILNDLYGTMSNFIKKEEKEHFEFVKLIIDVAEQAVAHNPNNEYKTFLDEMYKVALGIKALKDNHAEYSVKRKNLVELLVSELEQVYEDAPTSENKKALKDIYKEALGISELKDHHFDYRIKRKKLLGLPIKPYDEDQEANVSSHDFFSGGTLFNPNLVGKRFAEIMNFENISGAVYVAVEDGNDTYIYKASEIHNIHKYDNYNVVCWQNSGRAGTLITISETK